MNSSYLTFKEYILSVTNILITDNNNDTNTWGWFVDLDKNKSYNERYNKSYNERYNKSYNNYINYINRGINNNNLKPIKSLPSFSSVDERYFRDLEPNYDQIILDKQKQYCINLKINAIGIFAITIILLIIL